MMEGVGCSLGLRARVNVKTMEGVKVPVSCSSSYALSIGVAKVIGADHVTSNGILHYVDRVLIPPKG
ncbi:hypothetical protein SK128_004621, partial [Halocaridina rubra]